MLFLYQYKQKSKQWRIVHNHDDELWICGNFKYLIKYESFC